MRIFQIILMLMLSMSLLACVSDKHRVYAPVSDATIEKIPKSGTHRVRPGETLYSIAWRYGLDYRNLAKRNGLNNSYHIEVGETLYLRGAKTLPRHGCHKKPCQRNGSRARDQQEVFSRLEREPNAHVSEWLWPARASAIGAFSATNKGINIFGSEGAPIYASAAGKVVYSGHGLRGYGNLIIIKHNSEFLTAYAHNSKNLVTEGEWIKAGQVIAEMGETGARRIMLHFEIRRSGEPVNPMDYLR